MPQFRELAKRHMPVFARDLVIGMRERLSAPPLEDIVLHDYQAVVDAETRPRLSLIIPSIAADKAFGGVTTGVDVFLEIGKRTGADLRIILDDFEHRIDRSLVDKRAKDLALDPEKIEIVPRLTDTPRIGIRATDIFMSYNWWATLNIRSVVRQQHNYFGGAPRPYLYLIQEYEPLFYPFSSTHMLARLAFEPRWPCWGIFNSAYLYEYFHAQGHRVERAFVFEPRLSTGLRPFLADGSPVKKRRILVYGRPGAARNCFPAVVKGLTAWSERYPEFSEWEVLSAGLPHKPVRFGPNRVMQSLGKLPLDRYGQVLRTSAIGLSLMSSPHPSYPPLEMAHFGIRTITNRYANKDLAAAHENILSIDDIAPETIADALASACNGFNLSPEAGWRGRTHVPSFLSAAPFEFLDNIARELSCAWAGERGSSERQRAEPDSDRLSSLV
jgi:hypothetical protein